MEERIMVCAEELKKLKELLDNNIITQEDFEEKKKQLLSGSELYCCSLDTLALPG